jgi:hypothetical protein
MPVNTVHLAIKSILDGLIVPGKAGVLHCYITPVDPREDPDPAIYIWPSRGHEHRQSVPRASPGYQPATQSGWKEIEHTIDGFLTWFGEDSDSQADSTFPAVVDAVLQALRNADDPMYAVTDPLTGQQSDLAGIGEKLEYEIGPVRTVADQRYLRYDALITIQFCEWFQS